MKKIFILGLVFSIICIGTMKSVLADETYSDASIIKGAIAKYKNKNYLGCISDLRMYLTQDPSSAIAWYYLGNSYMNIAMKTEAHQAFDRVVQLNSVPKLTSYSIQAKICMENPTKCQYQDFTYDEIVKLKADPMTFLDQYFASLSGENKDVSQIEIERLIEGYYRNNIHPSARDFIMQEQAKMKQLEINANKASIDSPDKLAYAVKDLQKNNEIKSMAMMLDVMNNNNKKDDSSLLSYYKSGNNESNSNITPGMIQTMMMSNMMLMPN